MQKLKIFIIKPILVYIFTCFINIYFNSYKFSKPINNQLKISNYYITNDTILIKTLEIKKKRKKLNLMIKTKEKKIKCIYYSVCNIGEGNLYQHHQGNISLKIKYKIKSNK